jgi:uncharacterized membrane protein
LTAVSSLKSSIGIRLAERRSTRGNAPDQRQLVVAIGYVFTPVVPLVLLSGEARSDGFLRRHAGQALLWAVPFVLLLIAFVIAAIALMRSNPLTVCLLPVLFMVPFAPGAIWARQVYLGGDVNIPVITPLAKRCFPPT